MSSSATEADYLDEKDTYHQDHCCHMSGSSPTKGHTSEAAILVENILAALSVPSGETSAAATEDEGMSVRTRSESPESTVVTVNGKSYALQFDGKGKGETKQTPRTSSNCVRTKGSSIPTASPIGIVSSTPSSNNMTTTSSISPSSTTERRIHFSADVVSPPRRRTPSPKQPSPTQSQSPTYMYPPPASFHGTSSPIQSPKPQGALSPLQEKQLQLLQREVRDLRQLSEQQQIVIQEQLQSLDQAARNALSQQRVEMECKRAMEKVYVKFQQSQERQKSDLATTKAQLEAQRRECEAAVTRAETAEASRTSLLSELNDVRKKSEETTQLHLADLQRKTDLQQQKEAVSAKAIEQLEATIAQLQAEKSELKEQNMSMLEHVAAQQRNANKWKESHDAISVELSQSQAKLREVSAFVRLSLAPFMAESNPFVQLNDVDDVLNDDGGIIADGGGGRGGRTTGGVGGSPTRRQGSQQRSTNRPPFAV